MGPPIASSAAVNVDLILANVACRTRLEAPDDSLTYRTQVSKALVNKLEIK